MENRTSEVLSLQELAQLALGHGTNMSVTNIAVLYTLIKTILKKLDCENEVVTLSGINSEELRELLNKANYSIIPCDENVRVLTKQLDVLTTLETKIAQAEERLDKHLSLKLTESNTNLSPNSPQTWSKLPVSERQSKMRLQYHAMLDEVTTRGKINFQRQMTANLTEPNTKHLYLKDQKSRYSVFKMSVALYPQESEESTTESDSFDDIFKRSAERLNQLGETFSAFKRRVEDMDGWGPAPEKKAKKTGSVWKIQLNAEEETTDESTEQLKIQPAKSAITVRFSEVADDKNDDDNGVPVSLIEQEDIFTIPSPENELARKLLKSPFFMQTLIDLTSFPIKSRLCQGYGKLEQLTKYLHGLIYNWEKMYRKSDLIDRIMEDVRVLDYRVFDYNVEQQDALLGMQEIFDVKVDKASVPDIKNNIFTFFKRIDKKINALQVQMEIPKVSFFTTQKVVTDRRKSIKPVNVDQLEYIKSETCDCKIELIPMEPTLLQRIQRFTKSDLESIKNRQNKHKRSTHSSLTLSSMVSKKKGHFE